jgi:RimJ/RimL family protein N-acetyltransferase
MNIPTLSTARLRLRAFAAGDLDAYAAIVADPEVMRHIGSGGPIDRGVAWRQLAMFLGEWTLRGRGQWAVTLKSDGRLIGRAGFLQPEGWPGIELAWLLARDAWGHGYASEAARAALAWARDATGLAECISLIRPENTRSIAMAQRLGALDDGEIHFLGGRTRRFRHALAQSGA